jgi:hypothetical protein
MKGIEHYIFLENYKLKHKGGITAHIFEQLKFQTLIIPKTGEEVEQQELPFISGENAK